MKLSDAKCRTARPTDAPYKLADGHGLYLFVAPNGSRLWRMDYRFDGKRLTLSFGPYPDIIPVLNAARGEGLSFYAHRIPPRAAQIENGGEIDHAFDVVLRRGLEPGCIVGPIAFHGENI